MIIVYDQREQRPYAFDPADYTDVKTEPGTLYTADYSLKGLEDKIAIERKSLDDLTGTLTAGRDRFTRECERGRGLDYFGLVIEASMEDARKHKYRSKLSPHSLFQSLAAFSVRYNLHIHWCGSREGGEFDGCLIHRTRYATIEPNYSIKLMMAGFSAAGTRGGRIRS